MESFSSAYISSNNESKTNSSKLGRIAAMSAKNLIRLKHNIPVIIFQLLTPTLCIILFCTCFGRDPKNVAVGVHSFDELKLSKWFLEAIDNSTISQMNFTSIESAMMSLKEGKIWAIIQIEPGFTKAIENRFYHKQNVDETTFEKSKIKVHIDWTNQIIGAHIQKTIFEAVVSFGKKCSTAYGEKYSSQTIVDVMFNCVHSQIQKSIYGDRKQSLTEFMTPGNIVIFVFFSAAASTSLVFVLERKEGTFKRCIVAGVNPHEFLISHVLQQILILIIQIAIMLFFTFLIFHIGNRGSLFTVIVLVFLQGFCGVSYGLFVSAISQQENHAFIILMGSLLPNFLISGFIWPLETMPYIMMQIGKWLPNAAAIDALRFVMYRGWTLTTNSSIPIGFLVTICWIIAFQTIALLIFRRAYFT
ncbi:ABC transporter G family member 23-like protein [Leptotrombidium deliense]|uniref:ABC transporter G family member 23-like protein n=1 Tax=Leptotrombidium deliense TaxID=299467 RepID=A0A443SE02_9ACAR|nr:ABC transporter G family member 23-like protein [Leptotrombidium deliense]